MFNDVNVGLTMRAIQENDCIMRQYKIGQNVKISSSCDVRKIRYGTIVGYALNCFDEICIGIDLVNKNGKPDIHHLNPGNKTFTITVLG